MDRSNTTPSAFWTKLLAQSRNRRPMPSAFCLSRMLICSRNSWITFALVTESHLLEEFSQSTDSPRSSLVRHTNRQPRRRMPCLWEFAKSPLTSSAICSDWATALGTSASWRARTTWSKPIDTLATSAQFAIGNFISASSGTTLRDIRTSLPGARSLVGSLQNHRNMRKESNLIRTGMRRGSKTSTLNALALAITIINMKKRNRMSNLLFWTRKVCCLQRALPQKGAFLWTRLPLRTISS